MNVDVAPLSEACERNKGPILGILAVALADRRSVLEVGSGTGQHALHFSRNLGHLQWQPTDTGDYLDVLRRGLGASRPANLLEPAALDVRQAPWKFPGVDAIFSANTLHIMDWESVGHFFRGAAEVLGAGGVLCVYGPFRYHGNYTSDSNAAFDRFLRDRDDRSGIRDFEAVDELARNRGFALLADHRMPANNQTLIWRSG